MTTELLLDQRFSGRSWSMVNRVATNQAIAGIAPNFDGSPPTRGQIETIDDIIPIQDYIDRFFMKSAFLEPPRTQRCYYVSKPIYIPAGTLVDMGGAEVRPTANFVGTLMPAWSAGTTYGTASGILLNSAVYALSTNPLVLPAIAAGGSGGTNGTQTVTGTTGTGTKFQAIVTIALGAITAIQSILVAGAYTILPTVLTAEPVTGAGLTGATLNLTGVMFATGTPTNVTTQNNWRVSYNGRNWYATGKVGNLNVTPGTDLSYWIQAPQGGVFELDNRTTSYTAWNVATPYTPGMKVTVAADLKTPNYVCLIAHTGQAPFVNSLYWSAIPAAWVVSEVSAQGVLEYDHNRSAVQGGMLVNYKVNGQRTAATGFSSTSPSTDTAPQVWGLIKNSTVDDGVIASHSLQIDLTTSGGTGGVDSFFRSANGRIEEMSGGPAMYVGRGGALYVNTLFENCNEGVWNNEYDSHHVGIEWGNMGTNGLRLFRENSRQLNFTGGKIWRSGERASKLYQITSGTIDTFRRTVLGEPTMPGNPTKLVYTYGTAGAANLDNLTQGERQQREAAYVGGLANIMSTTNAWTSGGAANGTHSGGTVDATGSFTLTGVPLGDKLTLFGNDITFISGASSGQNCQAITSATVTAAALASLINGNPLLWPVSASPAAGVVTLTSLVKGVAGNKIDLKVKLNTNGFLTASGAKLTGGSGQPLFGPVYDNARAYVAGDFASTGGVLYQAIGSSTGASPPGANWTSVNVAVGTPNAPNGLPFTTDFGGHNIHSEASETTFMVKLQDSYGGEIYEGGKRNNHVASAWGMGPDQTTRKYYNKPAIRFIDGGFTDSGCYNYIQGAVVEQGDPTFSHAILYDVNAKYNEVNLKLALPTVDMVAGLSGAAKIAGRTLTGNVTLINNVDVSNVPVGT